MRVVFCVSFIPFIPRRMYLMDKFSVTPDPWDNRIIVSFFSGLVVCIYVFAYVHVDQIVLAIHTVFLSLVVFWAVFFCYIACQDLCNSLAQFHSLVHQAAT